MKTFHRICVPLENIKAIYASEFVGVTVSTCRQKEFINLSVAARPSPFTLRGRMAFNRCRGFQRWPKSRLSYDWAFSGHEVSPAPGLGPAIKSTLAFWSSMKFMQR